MATVYSSGSEQSANDTHRLALITDLILTFQHFAVNVGNHGVGVRNIVVNLGNNGAGFRDIVADIGNGSIRISR